MQNKSTHQSFWSSLYPNKLLPSRIIKKSILAARSRTRLTLFHLDMHVVVGEICLKLPPALSTIRHRLVVQDVALRNVVGEL